VIPAMLVFNLSSEDTQAENSPAELVTTPREQDSATV